MKIPGMRCIDHIFIARNDIKEAVAVKFKFMLWVLTKLL
ncbi:hypothetical protein R69619_04582 [Paraburkholderia nemoris]|nr:hypothetical protein R69619_04582 [Paraburkholderia nemoris]